MVEIRRVSFEAIATDKNFPAILEGYADESAMSGMPPPNCQTETYNQMYMAGFMYPLAAYNDDNELLGLMFMLCSELPHYGVKVATAESFFVLKEFRFTGAGAKLLKAAEELAVELGAKGVLMSSPTGGRLAEVLPRSGYTESNRVFFKSVA